MLNVIFFTLITLLLSCTSNEVLEAPCDNLQGRIPEELREKHPYSNNLKSIIFENEKGEEFNFDVINKEERIETINATKEFPYELESLIHTLYNMELDMFFHIILGSGYGTYKCPESKTRGAFVSIRTPLEISVPASDESQSFSLIVMEIMDNESEILTPILEQVEIAGTRFEQVYSGNGDIITYFNFEIGLVGFIDKKNSREFKYTRTIIE